MKRRSQLAQNSSGHPKRPCFASIKEVCDRRSCLTEEDVQRVVREELERAKSHSTEYCQSCTGNALKEVVQQMHSIEKEMRSMKKSIWELKEAIELAIIDSPHIGRANAKSMEKIYVKDLRLRLQTKLSLPIFTGMKIKGEGGACISVALIDANTGDVVSSGLESSIKLEVVVLEGDFNNEDNWTHEEFESFMVKEREGKRQLLTGDRLVTLKGGVGEVGELIFTDNSSWNRSKKFRIGLKVASGYCGNTRIREAKTDAFPVREHRGESYMKHHPPASDDEVWRLKKIAKDGKSHQKLIEVGIHRVEDFLLQLFTDSQKLREILGKSITPKNWDILIDHVKTCKINRKLYWYYSDGMRTHGAVFNTDRQLIGLIKDSVCIATHQLSAQEKEHGDTIVKKAFDNWNDVRELNGETISGSMQEKRSSCFPSQVLEGQIENLTPVQKSSSSFPSQVLEGLSENLSPVRCSLSPQDTAATIGPEAPLADAGSTAERTGFKHDTISSFKHIQRCGL